MASGTVMVADVQQYLVNGGAIGAGPGCFPFPECTAVVQSPLSLHRHQHNIAIVNTIPGFSPFELVVGVTAQHASQHVGEIVVDVLGIDKTHW